MPRKRPRPDTEVRVVFLPRPSLADQVRAEVAAWAVIRQRLFNVFKNCADAAMVTVRYGQRTEVQARAAIEYAVKHDS